MIAPEDLAKIQADHGGADRVAHVSEKNGRWEAVFRTPTRSEWKRFRAMAHNPQTAPDSQEFLARATCVYPSRDAFDAMIERFPACADVCATRIGELAGTALDEMGKT